MGYTFPSIRNEYLYLINAASPLNAAHAARFHAAAHRLIKHNTTFYGAQTRTGIPAVWFAVINERESGNNFNTYLGNGDPLKRVTTHVPKGRGPFASWIDGAVDATTYDHVGRPGPEDWSWAWFLYRCEAWNGFGPRMRGRRSGYLWAGTQMYTGGKYVADGVWDADAYDTQLGVFGLARAVMEIEPSMGRMLSGSFKQSWGAGEPETPDPRFDPQPAEAKLLGIRWLQDSLNKIQGSDLAVDGSYGRHTRAAVRKFQDTHGLRVDGQAGDLTCAAIDAELAKMPKLTAHPKSTETVSKPATAPVIKAVIPAAPDKAKTPLAKGPRMDFTNLMNLATMVAPQFAPALASSNPFLPVAVNVLGEALGLNGPHSPESVANAAAEKPADAVAAALQKAATQFVAHINAAAPSVQAPGSAPVAPSVTAPVITAPVTGAPASSVKQTGGIFMSQAFSGGLHAITAIGGVLLGSGLLDPAGPLSGMAKTNPWIGLLLTVGAPMLNWLMVKASNSATEHALK